jgi:hypothetical protein
MKGAISKKPPVLSIGCHLTGQSPNCHRRADPRSRCRHSVGRAYPSRPEVKFVWRLWPNDPLAYLPSQYQTSANPTLETLASFNHLGVRFPTHPAVRNVFFRHVLFRRIFSRQLFSQQLFFRHPDSSKCFSARRRRPSGTTYGEMLSEQPDLKCGVPSSCPERRTGFDLKKAYHEIIKR